MYATGSILTMPRIIILLVALIKISEFTESKSYVRQTSLADTEIQLTHSTEVLHVSR